MRKIRPNTLTKINVVPSKPDKKIPLPKKVFFFLLLLHSSNLSLVSNKSAFEFHSTVYRLFHSLYLKLNSNRDKRALETTHSRLCGHQPRAPFWPTLSHTTVFFPFVFNCFHIGLSSLDRQQKLTKSTNEKHPAFLFFAVVERASTLWGR